MIVGTTVHTLNLSGCCLFIKDQSYYYRVSAAQGTLADIMKQNELLLLISHRDSKIQFPDSASKVDPDIEFLIPLPAGQDTVGILYIAPKESKQKFSSDDIYLLQGLASVSAAALRSAMLIRDVSLRDTFVSIASHELRTPLTGIMGYADLLVRKDPPQATRKKWLKYILEDGQNIKDMVDELLNVSRIQSRKITMKLERVNIADIISERLVVAKEGTNIHEFAAVLEPGLPEALADRDKLGQVLGNLLGNAVKFSPNGGLITVSAYNETKRNRIIVSVEDHGIGIGPQDKEWLFKTFHRIRRPETTSIRGSGLGLYIVKEWTEAMGGEVWLDSELNKGSSFFVSIPIANVSKGKD